jgi:hypothetical protein
MLISQPTHYGVRLMRSAGRSQGMGEPAPPEPKAEAERPPCSPYSNPQSYFKWREFQVCFVPFAEFNILNAPISSTLQSELAHLSLL